MQSIGRAKFGDGPRVRTDTYGAAMNDAEIARRIELLRVEHRDLDSAIDALRMASARDELQIARLKKRKLRLRDEIQLLEDQLIPDIIA